MATFHLRELATCRSGDKGNHANLGVVARSEKIFELLKRELTSRRVQDFFTATDVERVERFELPQVGALNFVLYNCLGGGASRSLRIDTQGKLFGTAAEEMPIDAPDDILRP